MTTGMLTPPAREEDGAAEAPARPALAMSLAFGATTATSGQILLASAAGRSSEVARLPMVVLGMAQVAEVMTLPDLLPPPEGAPGLLGSASWRDKAVPVVDLGGALGLPPFQAAARSRLLIARLGDGSIVGFPVHANIQTARLPLAAAPDEVPEGLRAEAVLGCFLWEGVRLIVPDLERIPA
jgi:chemotaxis signal transduction protein